jgi:hypothetical protein
MRPLGEEHDDDDGEDNDAATELCTSTNRLKQMISSMPAVPIEEGISNSVVDSLYHPSHYGDDIEWVPDFVDEDLNREEGEDDETPIEEDHEEQAIFEVKGSPRSRRPKRSNRGIHSHFYGFYTTRKHSKSSEKMPRTLARQYLNHQFFQILKLV